MDWIKGQSKTLINIKLPKSYELHNYTAQHESGKVSVNQGVSMIIGGFNLNTFQLKLPKEGSGNLRFMERLNKVLQWEREA